MSTLHLTTAGESHGPAEVCVLCGVPAGLAVTPQAVDAELARRQLGHGRGGRMTIETDRCRFLSGVRLGVTLGSPITILVENRDHANWRDSMSPEPLPEGRERPEPLTIPRPGHADLAGAAKHGHNDIRNVLERASARETVARVAGGAVCKRLLSELGVTIRGRVTSIGDVNAHAPADLGRPGCIDWEAAESSSVGCDDATASEKMRAAIDAARAAGESLGGVFEVWCWGVCPGLGGYARMEDRLDGRLLGAVGCIPAIKGAEIGYAFANTRLPGSRVHDPIVLTGGRGGSASGAGFQGTVARASNNAGGLEGGVSNGAPIVVRAAMKPIPTLTTPLPSVDLRTMEPVDAHHERSDITAVPAARVVAEAMVAYVVAGAYLEKFGGDRLSDLIEAVTSYEKRLEAGGLWRRS